VSDRLRVLLAGGGSGGSATPVLAVAQAVRAVRPEARFLYVGTRSGPEAALAAAQGLPFVAVATGKLRRYWDRQNLVDPFRVLAGLVQCGRLAREFGPNLAFAAGGFASVPPMVAARMVGARTVIHQQDVEPGLANRLLVPFACRITLALPGSARHFPPGRAVVTGNPVRREVLHADPRLAYQSLGLDPTLPLVVVTGGGTGALSLNRLAAAAAPRLVGSCQVLHLAGRGRSVAPLVQSPRYRQVEFLVAEMPHVLAAADLVVTRAGMGTLTELAALARATVVVPLPDSHQAANARAFAMLGAVESLDQALLDGDRLADVILSLLADESRRRQLGQALAASMPPDAADQVARALLALVA